MGAGLGIPRPPIVLLDNRSYWDTFVAGLTVVSFLLLAIALRGTIFRLTATRKTIEIH